MLFISVFVGMLWTVDTLSLQGPAMQTTKSLAVYLYKRTEYEIWKLKFYYTHQVYVPERIHSATNGDWGVENRRGARAKALGVPHALTRTRERMQR